ncbi:MAG: glutathione S-transferase family protein [Gammaproteobacteria bacterium]
MKLYAFPSTPNNRKDVAYIRHYDLDVEVHAVSFKNREQTQPEFLDINPMGKVPALVDGKHHLWESNAILTYLACRFSHCNALPTDTWGRADADRWLHWQSAHLTPLMGGLKTGAEEVASLEPLLKVLDSQLKGRDFILGELSLCDFAIAPYLLTKLGNKLDYSGHPHLADWRMRMAKLKGFAETELRSPVA